MKLRIYYLILFLITVSNVFALDDRVLVLPPSLSEVEYSTEDWSLLFTTYENCVVGKVTITPREINQKWHGEIRVIAFYDMDGAFQAGQEFEADFVLMTNRPEGTDYYEMQLVDPWEMQVLNSVVVNSVIEGLFELEQKNWLFGTGDYLNEPEFSMPGFAEGKNAVNNYLHKNNTYPPEANIGLVQAQLEVEVVVSKSGVPVTVRVLSNSQPGYPFKKAVEQALWALKYTPAKTKKGAVNALLKKRIYVYPEP